MSKVHGQQAGMPGGMPGGMPNVSEEQMKQLEEMMKNGNVPGVSPEQMDEFNKAKRNNENNSTPSNATVEEVD